jgi:hypothetical protein
VHRIDPVSSIKSVIDFPLSGKQGNAAVEESKMLTFYNGMVLLTATDGDENEADDA